MSFEFLAKDPLIKICLPLYVYSCCDNYPQSKTEYPLGASQHHFILTRSGTGQLEIGSNQYLMTQGKLIFLRKDVPYSISPLTDDWRTCFITFNGNSADKLLDYYKFGVVNVFDDEFLSEQLIKICHSTDKKINEEELSEALYNFINETGNSIYDILRPKPLVKALRYIKNNYTDAALTVNNIVEVSGTSTTKLFKMFKQMENVSPAQYVANIRMNHAKDLLLSSNYSVNDIAQTVGYETANYFSYAFRRHEGMTPLAYRKKYFGMDWKEVNKERRKGPTEKELLELLNKFKSYDKVAAYIKEKYNLNMNEPL